MVQQNLTGIEENLERFTSDDLLIPRSRSSLTTRLMKVNQEEELQKAATAEQRICL